MSEQQREDNQYAKEIKNSSQKPGQEVEYGTRCSYASLEDNGVCTVTQMAPIGSSCTCPSRFGLTNGSIVK